MTTKLIILDRDGVINYDSPDYIKSPEEWHAIPGSLAAIAKLNHAGFKVAVATNQSGIGRGYYNPATLEKINHKMFQELAQVGGHIEGLFFCPHTPEANCDCRKPQPGLLKKIAEHLQMDLHDAVMIGDSKRDIEAAFAVGAQAIYINPELKKIFPGVPVYRDLAAAVKAILRNPRKQFGSAPRIDFEKQRYQKVSRNELLLKAVGIKKDYLPAVLDLTAGLGKDAYLLYRAGCQVRCVERSPLIARLLQQALTRVKAEIILHVGEAKTCLEVCLLKNHRPDVIYFDPIFPDKNKTALSGKEIRTLRAIVGDDTDAPEVFQLALRVAQKRVVVKRPLHSKTITALQPDIVYKAKSIRFDVYIISASQ
jgi:D-glycero-D-manno-heptose 1,7-bisphosphate phosphatase